MKKSKNIFIIDSDAESLKLNDNHSEKPKVLYEDISKRGQNTKHFRLGNGNFATVLYNRPIHRLDKKSNLYIDVTPEIEEKNDIFEAITDRFNAKFPKTEGNQNFVSLEKDGREVAWKFIPDQILRIKKSKATFTRRFKENTWDVGNNPRLKYEGMDKNIDLQYEVSNNGIKESIVILKKTKRKTFSFHLKLKGLEPVLSDDKKTVFLVSDDKTQSIKSSEMIIPPAFMEDANKTFSDDLHYEISENQNGFYLNLVLETDWLAAPERAYPVIIDPRVELSESTEPGVNFVEVRSDDAYVTTNQLRVGVDSNGITHRAFWGFKLPQLADGYKITKAGLLLHPKAHVTHYSSDQEYSVIAVKNYQNEPLDFDSLNWTKARY